MDLRFSIAIPSFQQGRYLERALSSVLDQGVPTELFVLDGGSTDESVQIIRRHENKIAYWRSRKDEGQTAAINEGLARATGDIFGYLNSDDYYLPGALRKVAAAFQNQGVGWVTGDSWWICEGKTGRRKLQAEAPPQDPVLLWGHPWCPPQPSTFWKVELLRRHGPFLPQLKFNMDAEMAVRLAYAGEAPAILREPLSVRWNHAAAKSAERGRFFSEWRELLRHAPLPEAQKQKALGLIQNRIHWGRDVRAWGKWGQRLADLWTYPGCLAWYLRPRGIR